MLPRLLPCLILLGLAGALVGLTERTAHAESDNAVDFNRDIRPILSKNCFACHGPDTAQRAGSLRLDQRDAAIQPRKKSKPAAIVPGDPDHSPLVRRITATADKERMPPPSTGNHLTPAQIVTLQRWVKQGAPYAEHWAFVKPRRWPLPEVHEVAWPRNGIDHFILARLEREGLKPSPEADRYTLLRRASLDLRGLPPTPQEVDAFLADTSPDAYEKAVDRFLDDPAYGERWARMWLDLARYADSAGYGSDPLRTIWRYRDWVIGAFNRNLPYDQFTIEQIAGDLLPNAALEQRMATAFHRNTMTNTEGGTDREEFRVAAVKDRVDTTLQVWMGLTMGCAKCHNHKYDPISNQEYYRFFAFFNQSADNDQPDESPVLPAPTPVQQEQNRQIDARIAGLKRRLDVSTPELAAAQTKWEAELRGPSEWTVLEPLSSQAEKGTTLRTLPDHSLLAEGPKPGNDTYVVSARSDLRGVTAFRLEVIPEPSLPNDGAGRAADGNFVLSRFSVTAMAGTESKVSAGRFIRIELPGDGKILSLAEVQAFSNGENVARQGQASQSSTGHDAPAERAIDGNTDGDFFKAKSTTHTRAEASPWWEVKLQETRPIERIVVWNRTDGGVGTRLANFHVQVLDDARKVVWQQEVAEPPSPQLELSCSGRKNVALTQAVADFSQDKFPVSAALKQTDLSASGWAVAPQQSAPHAAVFLAAAPLDMEGPITLTFRLEHRYKSPGYILGRFRLSATADPHAGPRASVPAPILAVLDLPAEGRSQEQQETLARHYRSIAPLLQPIRDEIAKLDKSRPAIATLPVMVELPADKRRQTQILIKGNFLNKGDKVEPGVPAAFHGLPQDAPADRMGVARWLVDPENPLTARVAVNRYWAQLFGTGIVVTEEDFGTQGELPSHPELLDWLATEYVRLGWDTKALLRMLVTSATYRQSSRVTPESLAKDPHDRLLSRGPRFRLEAEMVRDQALQLSGLLSRKMGGPSVYPPQPPGLWQAAFNGQRTWATSTGEDRYRRGLYTFWRRTVPYPSMATFDAPSRETCVVRRIRTNTPLQAFVTLNDPVYVEAAQALARRIVKEGGMSAEERSRFGLRLCLARPPLEEQVQRVLALYESEREHYQKDAKAALAMATEPLGPVPAGMDAAELAAWTVVANVLLNLDGVMTKG
jgi:mono/diheme cytochrome c family protein